MHTFDTLCVNCELQPHLIATHPIISIQQWSYSLVCPQHKIKHMANITLPNQCFILLIAAFILYCGHITNMDSSNLTFINCEKALLCQTLAMHFGVWFPSEISQRTVCSNWYLRHKPTAHASFNLNKKVSWFLRFILDRRLKSQINFFKDHSTI